MSYCSVHHFVSEKYILDFDYAETSYCSVHHFVSDQYISNFWICRDVLWHCASLCFW